MTIEKGQDWGSRGSVDADTPIVRSDTELASLFTVSGNELTGPSVVGVVDGDLARTLGARADEREIRRGERTLLPIDLAIVTTQTKKGDMTTVMAASLVIKAPLWLGATRAVMNASYLGPWNVSPAGHPNDGRLDVIVSELGFGDRLKARKRLQSGTHVPHPQISIRRLKSVTWETGRHQSVAIDGELIAGVRSLTVTVCPDATVVAI